MPANIVADARPAARLFLNRTRCPDAHDEIAKRSPRSPPGGVKTEGLSDIQSSINFRGPATQPEIGRAHVRTPVTNAHLVCRLLLEKKKTANKTKRSNNARK